MWIPKDVFPLSLSQPIGVRHCASQLLDSIDNLLASRVSPEFLVQLVNGEHCHWLGSAPLFFDARRGKPTCFQKATEKTGVIFDFRRVEHAIEFGNNLQLCAAQNSLGIGEFFEAPFISSKFTSMSQTVCQIDFASGLRAKMLHLGIELRP